MKKKLLCAMLYTARWALSGVYAVLKKCLCVQNQVCFFSRQSDTLPLDFELLQKELREIAPQMQIVTICHRFRDRRDGVFRFAIDQLKSLYYLATSRVCVLDAYWPAVSMFQHRPELCVIQLWHSIGKIKRSGYQTLGMKGGRDPSIARVMRMHRNYDVIISGGKAWNPYYCQAFHVSEDSLRNYGLPRLDYLIAARDNRPEMERRYPQMQGKVVVLYAPTYRRHTCHPPEELIRLFSSEKYEFICRFHPNQKFEKGQAPTKDRYRRESTFALVRACDYLITDYSSLALEAAVIGRRTVYYMFDHDRYLRENGLNLDPMDMMPACSFEQAEDVFHLIDSGNYPDEELDNYRERYLPEDLGRSTEKIAALIAGAERTEESKVLQAV